ncbi:hypothetical protein PG997_014579 [Apiospora hydei]|uniref:Uncharacterized protein n=1 Tax=Apiospora hydei TaxID=1337664 RepID=A0ABR1UUV7_9PEZI
MASTGSRSSKKLPAQRGFAYDQNATQQFLQYPEYSSANNEPPAYNGSDFYSYDGYGYSSSVCSHQPPQQALGDIDEGSAFTYSAGDPCLAGIGSNFGGDPSFLLNDALPDPDPLAGESSTAASHIGFETLPGFTLGAGLGQSLPVDRSRDVYRAFLGIPVTSGQDSFYDPHSLDSSVYHGSSSNLGGGGGGGNAGPGLPDHTLPQFRPGAEQQRLQSEAPAKAPQIRPTNTNATFVSGHSTGHGD